MVDRRSSSILFWRKAAVGANTNDFKLHFTIDSDGVRHTMPERCNQSNDWLLQVPRSYSVESHLVATQSLTCTEL